MQPDPTSPLDLDALKALSDAATPGPWTVGNRWILAGAIWKRGECAGCESGGSPVWVGETDINGKVMPAHEHEYPDPWSAAPDVMCVTPAGFHGYVVQGSDDQGPNLSPADAALIAAAREAVPALLAALAEAQRELAATKKARNLANELRRETRLARELIAAQADAERMRLVVEAAKAWRVAELPPDAHNKVYRALNALAIAVDAFEHPEDAAETQEGTDG